MTLFVLFSYWIKKKTPPNILRSNKNCFSQMFAKICVDKESVLKPEVCTYVLVLMQGSQRASHPSPTK